MLRGGGKWVVAVAIALVCAIAAPGVASASGPVTGVVTGFSLQPPAASSAAGSAPTVTTSASFAYPSGSTDSVQNLIVTLPPGLVANPSAVPATCSAAQLGPAVVNGQSPPNCPAGSLIGSGTVDTNFVTGQLALYLMTPPATAPASEVADVGMVISLGGAPVFTSVGSVDIEVAAGQPVLQLRFTDLPHDLPPYNIQIQVTDLTLQIDGTARNGGTKPFIRLPTSCTAATATLSVDTYSTASAGTGSDSFTPTNCSSLAYAPVLSATATKDGGDHGVALVTTITHLPSEAADQTIALGLPSPAVALNLASAATLLGSSTPAGTATAVTPLLGSPLQGQVYLTGTVGSPALAVRFSSPVALTLTGAFSLATNTVTFDDLPDIPLTSLSVTIAGGASGLLETSCVPDTGTLSGTFTGRNGAAPPVQDLAVTVSGCPPPSTGNPDGTGTGTGTGHGSGTGSGPPGKKAVRVNARIRARWAAGRVKELTLLRLPRHARVELLCRGGGCPFAIRRFAPHGARLALAAALRRANLRSGATLEVRITAPGLIAEVISYRVLRGGRVRSSTRWTDSKG